MAKLVITKSMDSFSDVLEVDDQAKKIFSKLATLGNLAHDAVRRSMKDAEARKRVQRFKDMTDKVEDWWDEFRTIYGTRNHLHPAEEDDEEAENAERMPTVLLKKVRSFIPSLRKVRAGDHIASRTKALSDELCGIVDKAIRFDIFTSSGCGQSDLQPAVTTTGQSLPLIMGPDATTEFKNLIPDGNNDINHLPELLIRETDGVNVIFIVGKSGTGKTALAQLLYNDDKVKQYFELRAWVCNPKEESIASAHLESPAKSSGDSGLFLEPSLFQIIKTDSDHPLSLKSLFHIIKDSFSSSKFLLVMDDVRIENKSTWEPFRDSLKQIGAPGSMILVTTQTESVSTLTPTNYTYRLGLLSHSEGWSILKQISLSGRSEFCERMEKIGKGIVAKCGGLPLSVKIIGSHLQFKDSVEEWEEVLHSEIWKMGGLDSDDFRAIYISYNDLPLQLKRCFLYLAVFPIHAVIDVEKLIRLWMAEGYLGHPSRRDDKIMEMKGLEYFNNLAMRYFFHKLVKSVHKNKIISCEMHNKVHDFAKRTARGELLGKKKTSAPPAFLDIGKVRSFPSVCHSEIPQNFCSQWKSVRALDLSSCQLEELPRDVGNLILLQYLNLSGNPLKQLPETICDLYYLEFLDVHFCYVLLSLPQRIGELGQLRHLRINHTTDELQQMPQGFEKLSSIRSLDVFRAGGRYNDIAKLKGLNHLEEIRIAIHGKVNFGDALMEKKTNMENLELCFAGEGRDLEMIGFIKASLPPPYLKMLKLEGYPGVDLPKWIECQSFVNNLRRLTLRSALNLLSLSADLWKLSSLEFLWLYDIPKLKHLGREFFGLPNTSSSDDGDDDSGDDGDDGDDSGYDDDSDDSGGDDDDGDDSGDDDDDSGSGSDDDDSGSGSDDDEEEDDDDDDDDDEKKIVAFPSLKTLRIEYLKNWETWEDINEDDEMKINKIWWVMPSLEELIIDSCTKMKNLPDRILGKISSLKLKKVTELVSN